MKFMIGSTSELEGILRSHAAKYPLMQPADAVKLIYQNEFGGGHLIVDRQSCMERLRLEYGTTVKDPSIPLYETIGNGIVRVNLAAVREEALEQLGRDFIRSAAEHQGSPAHFKEKIKVLYRMAEHGAFSFGSQELKQYLEEYEKAGHPAVSHSPQYRAAYHPAYRIILKKDTP